MPNLATFEGLSAVLPEGLSIPNDASFPWFEGASGTFSGVTAPYLTKGADDSSSDDVDFYATLAIDAVVRKVSLELLCSLASTPGILASMYQVTDCSLSSDDVVTNLLLSLAGDKALRLLRRKRKRLRPSTGSSLVSRGVGGGDDSDDDEDDAILISRHNRNSMPSGQAASAARARHASSTTKTVCQLYASFKQTFANALPTALAAPPSPGFIRIYTIVHHVHLNEQKHSKRYFWRCVYQNQCQIDRCRGREAYSGTFRGNYRHCLRCADNRAGQ
jgi:hypothetical protein